MLLSSSNHDFGDKPVRLGPRVGQIGRPRRAEKLLQGRQQAGPDRRVVLGYHREAPVVTTQLLQEGHHLVDLIDVRDNSAQSGHQLVALARHLDREHRAHLGVAQEEVRVEVQRDIVACCRDLPPAGL